MWQPSCYRLFMFSPPYPACVEPLPGDAGRTRLVFAIVRDRGVPLIASSPNHSCFVETRTAILGLTFHDSSFECRLARAVKLTDTF